MTVTRRTAAALTAVALAATLVGGTYAFITVGQGKTNQLAQPVRGPGSPFGYVPAAFH